MAGHIQLTLTYLRGIELSVEFWNMIKGKNQNREHGGLKVVVVNFDGVEYQLREF